MCIRDRFTDAKIMGNPAKPVPAAETIPSAIDRLIGLVENGMKRHPSNDKRIPVERVFPEPNLSAIIPANGDIKPMTSWPKANAKLI